MADFEVGVAKPQDDIIAEEELDGEAALTLETIFIRWQPCLASLEVPDSRRSSSDLEDRKFVAILVDDVDS